MDINDNITKKLLELGVEIIPISQTVLAVISPEELPETLREDIRHSVTPFTVKFKVGPSSSTLDHLNKAISSHLTSGTARIGFRETRSRHAQLEICEGEVDEEAAWSDICDVLVKDKYYKSWEFNGRTYVQGLAKALQNNVQRHTAIGKDDLLNLRIALETSVTVDDLLRQI